MPFPTLLDISAVRDLYLSGEVTPTGLLVEVGARIDRGDPAAFISRTPAAMIEAAIADLLERAPEPNSLPLWGVPFAVKDNIDVAGLPTTCACPEFAYTPASDATVVARLVEAGAICVGKTNLDQFATGLNGTRSPYGAPRCVFNEDYISGGSSSGSAVAVAAGSVAFALGTDTAGSGRVPAMLNNVVGIKPTPGRLSTTGLVPACESLDCISIFALNVADGIFVRKLAEHYDARDPWSREPSRVPLPHAGLRVGVLAPEHYEFFGDAYNPRLYEDAIARTGWDTFPVDYRPFQAVAALLYEGPWVAERQAAFAATGLPVSVLDASVRTILSHAAQFNATDTFGALHELQRLRRLCEQEFEKVDVLLLPTAPRAFTVEEMLADPIARNAALGTYTNFCNLLGLSAIAVPAGFSPDGLPFGVTLTAPEFADDALAPLAQRIHEASHCGAGIDRAFVLPPLARAVPDPGTVDMAVVGAHLSGMPLNRELQALDARLVARTRTAADYRLFVLPGTRPVKPGMIRSPGSGKDGIDLEVWRMSAENFGRFAAAIPSPLGIGRIRLADGSEVSGFLCEEWAVADAEEITHLGGWRAFVEAHETAG